MREIKLTQDETTIVNDEDYELLSKYKWQAHWDGYNLYATKRNGPPMHRLIVGLPRDSKLEVDHINGDGLDNRRKNLRIVTHAQNICNSRARKNRQYKGVDFRKDHNKWRARITVEKKTHQLGVFNSAEAAARQYNYFARVCFGPYARLNPLHYLQKR